MRNFILALTSFIATVVLLSQVALATEDSWDPKHVTSAPGEEPIQNTAAGRSTDMPQGTAPESAENNQDPCIPCRAKRVQKKMKDNTVVRKDGTIVNDKAGDSSGQKGEQ